MDTLYNHTTLYNFCFTKLKLTNIKQLFLTLLLKYHVDVLNFFGVGSIRPKSFLQLDFFSSHG